MICVRRLARPYPGALAVPLILAGVLAAPTAAAAATTAGCQAWSGVEPTGPGNRENPLNSVTVISPCNAWAVGEAGSDTNRLPLIEHWNGSAWKQVTAQLPASDSVEVFGVHAVSSTDIWAVGGFESASSGHQTLTEHWDGSAWTIVPSPSPSAGNGNFDSLGGVSGVSSDDVWAVGSGNANNHNEGEILHWDGNAWTQIPSPNPGINDNLGAVVATSHTNAWAVGDTITSSGTEQTLILHWNGKTWTHPGTPTSPNPLSALSSVTATSATNAWAVGSTGTGSTAKSIILHWDGQKWARVTSPNPAGTTSLSSVTATSATNAWAVGSFVPTGGGTSQALILHWDGTTWSRVKAPSGAALLSGVDARSATNMWAVGLSGASTPEQPLALHCC